MLTEQSSQSALTHRMLVNYSSMPKQSAIQVPIDLIQFSLKQPRRYFDPEKLAHLIESVRKYGILEPIIVRPLDDEQYQLVAGERRIRAAREIGLEKVPAISLELDNKQALQIALMENLQREELNPVEETEAILELLALSLEMGIDEIASLIHRSFNAKQRGQTLNQNVLIQIQKIESLFSQIGKFNAGSFRASRLPLLNLPKDVLSVLRRGEIEYTKAQVIARLKSEQQRAELLQRAIVENLSLSEIRNKVKEAKSQSESQRENIVIDRFNEISKLLRKRKSEINIHNQERINQMLNELRKLIEEE